MSISFEKLKTLMDQKHIKKFDLRKQGVHGGILDKILSGGRVDTITINKLCQLLDCQPGDIMEYVKDENIIDK
jgi:putative transcriptional regulator